MMLLKGNGRFDFPVVGESFRQDELAQLAGPKCPMGHDLDCLAALLFDDGNAFDPKAVAVAIVFRDGKVRHVGFLAKADARQYRQSVAAIGAPDPEGMLCRAKIVGGSTDYDSPSYYGVKLDLRLPFRFGTKLAWRTWSERLL